MLLIRQLNYNFLIGSTIMLLTLMTQIVNGKPQDRNIFEDIATKGLVMAGNMAEMVGDAGMISKQIGFDTPFSKVNSNTQIGTGAAFRNENDDDSSEEDRRRKKRALNLPEQEVPCHGSGGSGGGTGTGTGTGAGGDEDVDVVERRRRAYARRMAARRKARNSKKTTRRTTKTRTQNKHLVDNDNDEQLSKRRRKRQSELDDLNQNKTNGTSKDFQQHAQQFADKIRNVFEGFMNQMNEMAQRLKQHLSGQNSNNSNTDEI